MRHMLSLFDLTAAEIERVFAVTEDLKTKFTAGVREPILPGRVLALLFEKPSLRTRVSFEAGIGHLGGVSLFLGQDVGWGERESIRDFAQVLGQYVDAVVCRAKAHAKVEELAQFAECAVINGLTDYYHPCQALADLYTVREIVGDVGDSKVAYVGDANNVARSLAIGCAKLGATFAIASPANYSFEREFVEKLQSETGELIETTDPREAVAGADAVYTDVWASMGQESEQERRAADFADYQVNSVLMSAAPEACFLHCLPARRGEEVTDDVIDGPQSAVVQQAANRMHVQKGLLAWLLASQH
ncbi:MAG: ornithine carbamoyltransferase [Pirellulaceae bacterium]|jgi:ornithine carbamoyltransferase|nr:ornithine carbamoyltransferase [Pirellulaceae bacterium]MDP7017287.1 ornithine carbamoyltransferase [Pirellulaceae bacterium]